MRIHPLNYEQYALDYLEGTLEPKTQAAFEEFLAEQPSIEKDLQEMKLFYARPDQTETYPNKRGLMKSPPTATASVFNLSGWAVAASWLIAIGSFAMWMYSSNQSALNEQIASNQAVIETMDKVEEDIVVVQVDVERPSSKAKTAEQQLELEEQYPPQIQTTDDFQHTAIAQESRTKKPVEMNQLTPQNQELNHTVAFLPQHTGIEEMEVVPQTPEVVYYKPITNWERSSTSFEATEEEPRLALMDPLKRVMKPEGYQKIKEFNLMEDVIKEIDGREVAHAFTPEILRNNR